MKRIIDLITKGYSAATILNRMAKQFPKYTKPINDALAAGYTANAVLKSIMQPKDKIGNAEEYLTTEEKIRKRDKERQQTAAGRIVQGATTAASLYGAARAAGLAGLASAAGEQPAPGETTIDVTPQPKAPTPSSLQQAVPEQPMSPINPPPALKTSEILPEPKIVPGYMQTKVGQTFPELGKYTERLIREGQKPEEIYGKVKSSKLLGPVVNRYEGETGQSFIKEIERLSAEEAKPYSTMQYIPKIGERMKALGKPELPEPLDTESMLKKFKITPFGAGEVVKETDKDSVVQVDNRLKKVPKQELELPSKEALMAVQDILQIPEIDRSSVVSLFTYDPTENKMYIQYHNGETYKYSDITPEEVEQIAAKNNIPITKGQNIYGAWSPEDKQSLGSALFKYVLSNPKYKKPKKGEEANPNYQKLETLYDYWKKLRKTNG
jgi:hypothetical protein